MKRSFTYFSLGFLVFFTSILAEIFVPVAEETSVAVSKENLTVLQTRELTTLSAPMSMTMMAGSTTVAFDLVGSTSQNLTSFAVTTSGGADPDTWSPGDWFGVASYGAWPQGAGVPFGLADDSVEDISGAGVSASDQQGIIDGTTASTDRFFSGVDMVNASNAGGTGTATWVFDISGFENLMLSIDMAAMGDFESSNDSYVWSYSIDGGAFTDIFTSSIDEPGSQSYTMQGGANVTLTDPMLINGITLNDVYQTLTGAITGTGAELTLRVVGSGDGGSGA